MMTEDKTNQTVDNVLEGLDEVVIPEDEEGADDTNITVETEDNPEELTEEQPAQEEKEPAPEMFPHKVKVLGEEKEITMDEAIAAIQKGLAYDEMKAGYKAKLAGAYGDKRIAFVDNLAKAAGMDADSYMAAMASQQEYKSLLDEYGGDINAVPAGVLKKFSEYSNGIMASAKERAAKKSADEYMAAKSREYLEFRENHPEVGNIPAEVIKMVSDGESLEGAWARYSLGQLTSENASLKRQMEILKTDKANRDSRLPTSKNTARKEDRFLEGLCG